MVTLTLKSETPLDFRWMLLHQN